MKEKRRKNWDPKYFFLFLFALIFVIWHFLVQMGVNGLLALFIGMIPAWIYAFATGILDYV